MLPSAVVSFYDFFCQLNLRLNFFISSTRSPVFVVDNIMKLSRSKGIFIVVPRLYSLLLLLFFAVNLVTCNRLQAHLLIPLLNNKDRGWKKKKKKKQHIKRQHNISGEIRDRKPSHVY